MLFAPQPPPPPPATFYNPFQHGFPRPPLPAQDGNGLVPAYVNPYAHFAPHGHAQRFQRKLKYVITVLKANFEVEQSVTLTDQNEAIDCFRKLFEECVVPASFSTVASTHSSREFCYAGCGTRAAIITGLNREGAERALHQVFTQKTAAAASAAASAAAANETNAQDGVF
jgi:hypothetical protein